jgi:pyruvate,orthophosphate dikinase
LFGEIVIGVAHEKFERVMDRFKGQTKGGKDTDLKPKDLSGIIAAQKEIMRAEHHDIPDDPYEQLRVAIAAVFNSWMGRRAIELPAHQSNSRRPGHRRECPGHGFRQHGREQRHGVAFTRNPSPERKSSTVNTF